MRRFLQKELLGSGPGDSLFVQFKIIRNIACWRNADKIGFCRAMVTNVIGPWSKGKNIVPGAVSEGRWHLGHYVSLSSRANASYAYIHDGESHIL